MEVADAVRVGEHDAHERAVRGRRQRRQLVRTLIGEHVQPGAEDRALGVDRDLGVELFVAGMTGRHQVLDAVLDPLHRSPEHERRGRHRDVLPADVRLLPERTADVAADHAHLVGVDRQQLSEMHPQGVCGF